MWRKILAAVFLSVLLVAGALLFGAEKLATLAATRVLDAAGLTLSYDRLELKLLAGSLAVSNLLLIEEVGNQPLVRIGEANLSVVPLQLLFGDNSGGELNGRDADIYLYLDGESESESDWEPGTWLGYRNLLPGNARIDNLNLHWRGDDPETLTRFVEIRIRPGDTKNQTLVEADLFHNEADARIEVSVATVEQLDDGLSEVGIKAEVSSQLYQARLAAEGALRGSGEALNYTLQAAADSADIQGVFQRFNVDFDLHGLTRIAGRMEGDLEGFSLNAEEVSLDYSPEYGFKGSGRFDYSFDGDSDLDLEVEGELAKMGQLIHWLDIDVAELGSVRASTRIQGSLDDLILRDAVVTTRSDKDLQVHLSGNLRVNNLSKNSLGDQRGIDALITAPDFAALQVWTGELDFETGPWRLAAHVREAGGKLLIRDIDLEAQGTKGVGISAQGQIGDAGSLLEGDIAGVKDIELRVEMSSPSSQQLTDLLDQEVRDLGPVTASAALTGTAAQLLVQDVNAETGIDGLHIELDHGSLQLSLAPEFRYSDMVYPLRIELDSTARLSEWVDWSFADLGKVHAALTVQQTAQGFGLPSLAVELQEGETVIATHKGSVQELSPFKGLTLEGTLNGLPTEGMIETLTGAVEEDLDVGRLHGGYKLASTGAGYQVEQINIENRGSSQLQFLLKGRLEGSAEQVDMDVNLETEVTDQKLLQAITGLELGALSANLQISGSQQSIFVAGNTRLGSTDLVSRLLLTIGDEGLADIKGSVTSARITLTDLGLGQVINYEEDKLPEDIATRTARRRDEELPLDGLPDFPIDVVLATAKIEGELFSAEDFSVHVRTGEGRYELIDLLLNYTGGSAHINASLDTRPAVPDWSINALLADFRIERLRDLGAPGNITGSANTILHLETQGQTQNQMLAKLDGEVAIALEDIGLKGGAYDRLAVDTVAWFYTGGVLEQETHFSCVMGIFDVEDGIAESNFLFAESDYLVADGDARVDLPAWEMEMAITPRSKRRTFQIPGTIKIRGPLDNLQVFTSPISTTVDTSAQVVLFAPSVAISMFDRTVRLFEGDKKEKAQPRKCPTEQFE